MGRRKARRPHRSAPAARPDRRARRPALAVHRPARALVRRPVERGRSRRDAVPRVHRLLPPRRRAERGDADGREAPAPRPPPHRWCRRQAEWHLDVRRARRHVRHRLPARGDDADQHRDLRDRRHPDGRRHRARPLARAPRQRRVRRHRGARRVRGDDRAAGTSSPCQVESAYYCIRVEHDLARPSGRILWLDDLMHSYVDLNDPTFLEFDYVQVVQRRGRGRVARPPGARRAARRWWWFHDAAVSRRRVSRARRARCWRSTRRC